MADIVGIEVFHRLRFVPRCQAQTERECVQSTAKHGQPPDWARHIPATHPRRHDDASRYGVEGGSGTHPGSSGEVAGAFFPLGRRGTPGAGISAPMASLRAPGAIKRGQVGPPLRGVALAGEMLERTDLTAEDHPAQFAFGLLVSRTISKAFAVGLRGRDRRGGNGRLIARPQVSVAVAMAALARPALAASLARHCLPSWRRSARGR